MDNKNKCPVIFIHGLFGWGDDEGINKKLPYWRCGNGELMTFLTESGYECYAASVGPISSAWDRACELYARLTGGTVDYGKAHSARHGHRRYGRSYDKPLFEGWSSEKKVHLVGHSFGGQTARLLAHLLEKGSPDEQAATDEDDLSPLFTGGKGNLIQSITAICSPHNGTAISDVAEKTRLLPLFTEIGYSYLSIVGRIPQLESTVDFHLEQFGMTNTPGKKDCLPFTQAKTAFKISKDSTQYDISAEGTKRFNSSVSVLPNVYYFSYAFNMVEPCANGKHHKPADVGFPATFVTSSLILLNSHFNLPYRNSRFVDYANDGLVKSCSALYPENEPHTDYNKANVQPGIWNVMPVMQGDHGKAVGLFADREKTESFYSDLMKMICDTEKPDKNTVE